MAILQGDSVAGTSVHERRRCTLVPGDLASPARPPAGEAGRRGLFEWMRAARPPRRLGLGLALGGLIVSSIAVVGLATGGNDGPSAPPAVKPPVFSSLPGHDVGAMAIDGESVEVKMLTYVPNEVTGWHRHTGLHAVAVISGTLTIYGPDCQPSRYSDGQAYVGGREIHLAINETDQPVVMAVTYIYPAESSWEHFLIPASAPGGCSVP